MSNSLLNLSCFAHHLHSWSPRSTSIISCFLEIWGPQNDWDIAYIVQRLPISDHYTNSLSHKIGLRTLQISDTLEYWNTLHQGWSIPKSLILPFKPAFIIPSTLPLVFLWPSLLLFHSWIGREIHFNKWEKLQLSFLKLWPISNLFLLNVFDYLPHIWS